MSVSESDRDAMKRILSALDGDKTALKSTNESAGYDEDLVGPGQVSPKAISAMAQVLTKLNDVTSQVVTESRFDPQLSEALHTHKTDTGVNIGSYKIMIKEDQKRLAGKQYYGIYNTKSGDIIANDLTLYEVSLAVVKQLNAGKFVNSTIVRNLFEIDDKYTSCRIDAIRFKYKAKAALNAGDYNKSEMYESRYQNSVTQAMQTKRNIKSLITDSRISTKKSL